LGLPLFEKDTIKERLADCLGEGEREYSRALGLASMLMLVDIARELLAAGQSVLLECYFHHGKAEQQLGAVTSVANSILIHCTASRETLIERYAARMTLPARHAIHEVGQNVDKQTSSIGVREADEPLDLAIPRLIVSTTDSFPDAAEIAAIVSRLLSANRHQQAVTEHWP
jgi:predicted kinase